MFGALFQIVVGGFMGGRVTR